jgi:hypothetical protein
VKAGDILEVHDNIGDSVKVSQVQVLEIQDLSDQTKKPKWQVCLDYSVCVQRSV